mmetsp:Transcript_32126/g.84600  ORF Transcript_32126/g.84600 Transcript_32126/m.84600 type:complete len:206 (+) Transcript_32126:318-935(+)
MYELKRTHGAKGIDEAAVAEVELLGRVDHRTLLLPARNGTACTQQRQQELLVEIGRQLADEHRHWDGGVGGEPLGCLSGLTRHRRQLRQFEWRRRHHTRPHPNPRLLHTPRRHSPRWHATRWEPHRRRHVHRWRREPHRRASHRRHAIPHRRSNHRRRRHARRRERRRRSSHRRHARWLLWRVAVRARRRVAHVRCAECCCQLSR